MPIAIQQIGSDKGIRLSAMGSHAVRSTTAPKMKSVTT
jgi:hypothetical protein